MKRLSLTAAGVAALCSAAIATPASAAVVELGATPSAPLTPPTCPTGISPANCTIILTRVTALETIRAGIAYPTTVTKPGKIVAFTLGLSRLNSDFNQATSAVHYLNTTYGGAPRASITVLKATGRGKKRGWQVMSESEQVHLQPYLGQVVQFPLQTPLTVVPHEVIALTVPTWAPVLSFNLASHRYAYRQSRTANCANPPTTNQAQTVVGSKALYGCNYPGTRVEYSATEVTNPTPAKKQIH